MADNTLRFRAILDDKVSSGLDKMHGKFDTLGKSAGFKSVAQGVGIGAGISALGLLGSAIGGVSDYVGNAIDDASDLNETLSKSEAVFGANASAAEKFGDSAATSMGLSKQEAIEAEATFGNLFKTIGLGERPTLDMSQGIVKLAADLGSFNNIPVADALEKLRSGLSGEAEPLRSLGVFLTEASVKAKGMELGLADVHGELSEGAKVQARYALIMDQTTTAQGDFDRTSDGLANTSKSLNAEMADLSTEVGIELLPYMRDFAKTMRDDVVPALHTGIEAGDKAGDILTDIANNATGAGRALHDWVHDNTPIGPFVDFLNEGRAATDEYFKDVNSTTVDGLAEMRQSYSNADRGVTTNVEHMRGAIFGVGTTTKTTAEKTIEALDKVVDEAHTAEKALHGLAQSAIDDYYGPIIARDKLLANQAEIAAAKRVLASKTATAAEKRDARSTLHQLEADNLELNTELAFAGKLSKKEQSSLLADLQAKYKTATGAAKIEIGRLIEKIKSIPATKNVDINVKVHQSGGGIDGGLLGKAGGGPVEAGVPYLVGEDGAEIIVPKSAGMVIPHDETLDAMRSGSALVAGGNTFIFNYAPQTSTASPTEAQRFARNVIPELVREMRRQRVLPAA